LEKKGVAQGWPATPLGGPPPWGAFGHPLDRKKKKKKKKKVRSILPLRVAEPPMWPMGVQGQNGKTNFGGFGPWGWPKGQPFFFQFFNIYFFNFIIFSRFLILFI
jgi:hypothetical protein